MVSKESARIGADVTIVYITPTLDLYGASRTLQSIIKGTSSSFSEIIVICPNQLEVDLVLSKEDLSKVSIIKTDFPVIRRKNLYSITLLWHLFVYLRQIIRFKRAFREIVFSKTIKTIHVFTSAPILCAFGLQKYREKLFLSIHEYPRNNLERFMVRVLSRVLFKKYACASNSIKSAFGLAKAVVVYSGTDLSKFFPSEEERTEDQILRIVCVGRFNSWKGQDTLIEAMNLLPNFGINATVDFFGTGFGGEARYLDESKQAVKRLSLDDKVIFHGDVRDISSVLSNYDVSVIPSKTPEPFGKVVVESMASALITIASNHGGPTEVIEEGVNGFLFTPNDPNDLALKLKSIMELSFEARSRLRSLAVLRSQEFSDDKMNREYLTIYESI
jgi:glycosyltransferase involved in cell wall biosynthesis